MATSRIRIKWFGENVKKLTLSQAEGIVEKIAKIIFEQSKAAVTVLSGDLKKSGKLMIKHTPKAARARISFGNKSTVKYAVPHEADKPYLWPAVRNQKGKVK